MKLKFMVAVSFFLVFCLSVAGYASETYVPPDEGKPDRVAVQSVYREKCSSCHELSRADKATKTVDEWKNTISRMRSKNPGWISAEEEEKIFSFLAGRMLTAAKCSKCHDAARADVNKTVLQWQTTLDRMQGKDKAWISDKEKSLIKFFLTDVYLLEL